MLKHVTVEQRVDKYKQYGLYNNDGALFCRPCGKRVDMHREDTIKDHIVSDLHESQVLKRVNAMYPYVFVGMQFFFVGGLAQCIVSQLVMSSVRRPEMTSKMRGPEVEVQVHTSQRCGMPKGRRTTRKTGGRNARQTGNLLRWVPTFQSNQINHVGI